MVNEIVLPEQTAPRMAARRGRIIAPEIFFIGSAIFHYLGPAFAVLLFSQVDVLGVVWLRIASAAAAFAIWKRPWRLFAQLNGSERLTVISLGVVLAIMNICFYIAINRLPLATEVRSSSSGQSHWRRPACERSAILPRSSSPPEACFY